MKPSLRFLTLAVIGWAGVRAAMLDSLPGAELFSITPSAARVVAPIAATQFPALDPLAPEPALAEAPPPIATEASAPIRYVQGYVGVPVAMSRGATAVYRLPAAMPAAASDLPPPRRLAGIMPMPTRSLYSELPTLDQLASIGGMSRVPSRAAFPAQSVPIDPRKIDRLQLSTWALLRSQQTGVAGSRSLASGGQLGASQAGARLVYNLDRRLALTGRISSEVGRRGGEVAAGVRVHPIQSIPIWLTAERRQAVGKYGGGRSAFAFFLEGGLYDRPLPWDFRLNSYVQGGVVGLKSRDLFVDGGFTVTRPVWKQFSAGFGVWGAAQPHLYRVEAGPRVTMKVRNNLKVHVDWRQKLAGNARPGSGPALTLAGDF
jgi:hypothetical protein